MTSFDLKKYAPDVQAYIKAEQAAASSPMYKNETYTNTLGIKYKVIEDSPAGQIYVKVKSEECFGTSIKRIPKIVLCS